MKKIKFSPNQIVKSLQEFENGLSAIEVGRKHVISQPILYSWRRKYGGIRFKATKLVGRKDPQTKAHGC